MRITKKKEARPTKRATLLRTKRLIAVFLLALLVFTCSSTALADGEDPIQIVNNLQDFIFGIIRAIGIILVAFGIVQVGLSLKSHDPSQRANGFLTLAGGIIIALAKEVLQLIGIV